MRFLRAILGSIGSTAPLIASTAKISKLLSPPILAWQQERGSICFDILFRLIDLRFMNLFYF